LTPKINKIKQTKIQNMHKMKYNSPKNNNRNQQSISNLHTFSSVHCQKEKYSNETKLFSSINFIVLGSWSDNKTNNDMLALLYTSN
jgi:hypothetical protein